jgi:hypothetical protein
MIYIMPINFTMKTWLAKVKVGGGVLKWIKAMTLVAGEQTWVGEPTQMSMMEFYNIFHAMSRNILNNSFATWKLLCDMVEYFTTS